MGLKSGCLLARSLVELCAGGKADSLMLPHSYELTGLAAPDRLDLPGFDLPDGEGAESREDNTVALRKAS